MKFYETHFEEYIRSADLHNLHPKLEKNIYAKFPNNIHDLKNVIMYGPSGSVKYTQMLKCIKKYSPSDLKYEKRFTITFNKQEYYFKISDIHYEVDMGVLGCNSKLLWHDIYQQIIDVISTKQEKTGIIVCKNFHDTHSELLDNFYNYMQTNVMEPIKLVFFLLAEHVSFIPDNVIKCCQIVHVARPSATLYKKCFPHMKRTIKLTEITNMKMLNDPVCPLNYSDTTFDNLYNYITGDISGFKFNILRELLYDILIYDISIHDIVWNIMSSLIRDKHVKSEDVTEVILNTHTFFKYYNNNYRPIYHMESYIIFLVKKIHNCDVKKRSVNYLDTCTTTIPIPAPA